MLPPEMETHGLVGKNIASGDNDMARQVVGEKYTDRQVDRYVGR